MFGNPAGSARRRSSSSRSQEQHNFNHPQLFTDSSVAPDIQQTIDPLMNYNFAPDHENDGPSSSTGKKGRSRNFKGIRLPENKEIRKWVKLTDDKLQFADPNIHWTITSLWKSRFDGLYFTYERVPQSKIAEIYNCFKLLTYWDSDEYKRLSARGAKNRSSGERVTHITGSISFVIHEMRMDTYVVECTDSHGYDASLWPRMDNEAWVKAVGGCSSNFMPTIGSQVNPEMVGFTYRKRQPRENLIATLMASDYEETQAKDHDELERQRQQIALMQQQLANMTEAQNNMSQTIAQSVAAALAAHGISPQAGHHLVAPPQLSHGHGSSLHMNSAFTYSTNSTQTSHMVLEYQQQRQFPPQNDDAYHPTFDPDYQGP
ncbi:hypothetical protein SLEP1_g54868 [Rubroshorea leprosula]|uniref:Uncharacterized protein n=1 Tax=Rubroshorea leprosula TaxID=152421 RepID=A0AAV5MFW4_9ROSI|nr:hypothetical protein SLEP1_g54868 [Rubroshorea leprosula]